jgi:hypothetical protein
MNRPPSDVHDVKQHAPMPEIIAQNANVRKYKSRLCDL